MNKKITLLLLFILTISMFTVTIPLSSAYTGTITYNAGTDTITVIGGTSGTPITFEDLYLADVAGGWGQISRDANSIQYQITCKLIFGDGNTITFFNSTRTQITFYGLSMNNAQNIIDITVNATLTFGLIQDYNNKGTRYGCMFYDRTSTTNYYRLFYLQDLNKSKLYLYSCSIYGYASQSHEIQVFSTRMWNCFLDSLIQIQGNSDVFNVNSQYSRYAVRSPSSELSINNLVIKSVS